VQVVGLSAVQSCCSHHCGEVTAIEATPWGRIEQVWVKLMDHARKLPIKVPHASCRFCTRGVQKGDYVQLHSLPRFQVKYSHQTGYVLEVLLDKSHTYIDKVRVKLPDQLRRRPILVSRTSVTLKAKQVQEHDRVLLKYLPAEFHGCDGLIGTVVRTLENDQKHGRNSQKSATRSLCASNLVVD